MPASNKDRLSIDIETYSSIELKSSGVYRYTEAVDFEILLFSYAFNDEEVECIDLTTEELPERVVKALTDHNVIKCAFNAAFERVCLRAMGYDTPTEQWECTMVKALSASFPGSLKNISKALDLGDKEKADTGTALINYFSKPCKPTKINGGRFRNLPEHNSKKWYEYAQYNIQDVVAEREAARLLRPFTITPFEQEIYALDQRINDRGVKIDKKFVIKAKRLYAEYARKQKQRIKELTRIDNPNSGQQLMKWLSWYTGKNVTSLAADRVNQMLEEADDPVVREVLSLKQSISKTSIKKYDAMINCICADGRARGLFQLYGASRTCRWAGRLIQLQNLKRNYLQDLDAARMVVANKSIYYVMAHKDCGKDIELPDLLSQLIRTAIVAKEEHTFLVADFSAIEARVIAWLSGEQWRLDVFNGDGKIYEASASRMFGVPIDQIDSELRSRGKVAELALGFGGSIGAVRRMPGGDTVGDDASVQALVDAWRRTSPNIVKLWSTLENAAKAAIANNRTIEPFKKRGIGLAIRYKHKALQIKLPSGRVMSYQNPSFGVNNFGGQCITYMGQDLQAWARLQTYGGKLTENIVQAIARDLMAAAMMRLDKARYEIVMHVHDEVVVEFPKDKDTEHHLKRVCDTMGEPVPWAEGLPLRAEGYITDYYKKD